MESRKKRKFRPGITVWIILLTSAVLLAANLLLGAVLVEHSKKAMISLIHNRMLDIANTAADMVDGDALYTIRAEDKGTETYQLINDTLAVFQANVDLEYIYGVRESSPGEFTFTVDPAPESPGEFGSPVAWTEALQNAARGEPSVDDTPYTDDWGKFYNAYRPVDYIFHLNNHILKNSAGHSLIPLYPRS